jgi:cyclophilin family peptidyl-prolyl cis-trans isomerase
MRSYLFGLICLLAFLILGCGGSSAGGASGSVNGVSISPNPIHLKPTESIQLTAILDGGAAPITWAVNSLYGGTVTQGGVYTAPVASGTYEVQVALSSNPSKFGKTSAIVDSTYVVSISSDTSVAGPYFVPFNGTSQLTAKVNGASSDAVTWITDFGTISSTGLLTAPSSAGTAHVTARSVADPGKTLTISIGVVPPVSIVNGSDTRLALPSSKFTFTAKVNGILSPNVDWTVDSGVITTAGVWTADASFTGTATITAKSKADNSKLDSALVTVAPNLNVRFSFLNQGDVVLALRPDKAPLTCANLVSLANAKFYEGILIHRFDVGSVLQWGDPLTKTKPLSDPSIGTGGPGYTIDFEPNDLLNLKYSLGMARASGLNTAGSQIYINLADNAGFDGSYVVFGSVFAGTSVVDALRKGDKVVSATVELP